MTLPVESILAALATPFIFGIPGDGPINPFPPCTGEVHNGTGNEQKGYRNRGDERRYAVFVKDMNDVLMNGHRETPDVRRAPRPSLAGSGGLPTWRHATRGP